MGNCLQRRCISYWLNNTTGIKRDKQTLNFVNDAEKLSDSEPELACYFFGNRFVKEITFEICGRKVHNIGEMIQALFASPAEFYLGDGLRKLRLALKRELNCIVFYII